MVLWWSAAAGLKFVTYAQKLYTHRHNEIKYQGEVITILRAMDAHGLQPEVKFSNFLALHISNAV